MKAEILVIKLSDLDNVAVVPHAKGLQKGTALENGLIVQEYIPMGHKVAIEDILKGESITRYGQKIAIAIEDIKAGNWVNEHKISLPVPPDLDSILYKKPTVQKTTPLEGYTFDGYKNADGSVGTKNLLAISNSVQCVAGLTEFVVKKIKKEFLPKYPNVDGVVGLNHSYGCGVAINAPGAIVPIRTLKNIALNPNFGGHALVIGLGCEKLRPESIVNNASDDTSVFYMQSESNEGFMAIVDDVMNLAEKHLKVLNKRKRVTCPASDLVVGMQCGGSDAFSGITANPAAGFAADLIVSAGGSVMFSEVTEVRDAIHLLIPRAVDEMVAEALKREMLWYDDYLKLGEADRSANTSPGNKRGGLSTIVEKALGSIAKSGTSPIVDVLGPGEKIRKKGLNFAATPAGDFVCGTLQLASGMNMHVFMTGRGTPYGLAEVPVIKVSTNSVLSKRWFDLIDLDTGQIASGTKSIEEMGWELFKMILDVASGKMQVAADKLELHNDLVLFNPGPLT
ncbi:galactarate dehydratase [uncultured Arcticibacterium sp.]|uniref:galactarate dehydratase n=1 Tax=uncultured Arcticibacterium sp. TaxID=2173042 RepID=UPI0030FCE13C